LSNDDLGTITYDDGSTLDEDILARLAKHLVYFSGNIFRSVWVEGFSAFKSFY
jgi:hypothetical protein